MVESIVVAIALVAMGAAIGWKFINPENK